MSALGDGSSAFSRALASNSRKQRDVALFALKQWLGARSSVEETDLLKLWKGLFYAMWHADKAPVQAEVAENMAAVLDACQPEVRLCCAPLPPPFGTDAPLPCLSAGGISVLAGVYDHTAVRSAEAHAVDAILGAHIGSRQVELTARPRRREWPIIDRLRLDKYMVLVRRMLCHAFKYLARNDWYARLRPPLCDCQVGTLTLSRVYTGLTSYCSPCATSCKPACCSPQTRRSLLASRCTAPTSFFRSSPPSVRWTSCLQVWCFTCCSPTSRCSARRVIRHWRSGR
jgi:Nucleolar protein,Nop52